MIQKNEIKKNKRKKKQNERETREKNTGGGIDDVATMVGVVVVGW